MKRIMLFKARIMTFMIYLVSFFVFSAFSNKLSAQAFCDNEFVYWTEDFGTGGNITSNSNVVNLVYDNIGGLGDNGTYRIIDQTDQYSGWHKGPDHTPNDTQGKMLVVNGNDKRFYRKTVLRQLGYPAGFYSVSFFLINVNVPGFCDPNPLLPVITIKAQYRDANNNWVDLINSPVTSAPVPQTAVPTWVQIGGVFTLPTTGTFVVKRMRFFLSSETPAGCGNEFAIDDIKLASCPTGGPVPVQFLNITARQKGTGVLINWSTASEMNNKYFDVERSTDGGSNWNVVATVPGSLNSSTTKNYAAYDAKPVAGINFYRIKQVDLDAASKYSATVTYNLKIVKTEVSVLANPFSNNITIDFLSTGNQALSSRLFDISGRQLLSQQFNITKGSSRKVIDEVSRLNRGMYILQIIDEHGEVLYNNKLIKQ